MHNPKQLSCPAALEVLLAAVDPVAQQELEVTAAANYVLAETLYTPRPFPDTRRSAVDGFALGGLDAGSYRLTETLGAEDLPQQQVANKTAAAVMTGATVPEGARAVVRIENTERVAEQIIVAEALKERECINAIGEEAIAGAQVLAAGQVLGALAHSVACSLGQPRVRVYRRPRIGVMVTGNELLRPGEAHRPGMVYECNSTLLKNVLAQFGAEVEVRGPVVDDPEVLAATLEELAAKSDLVVTSGGVSMGKFDYVRPLLQRSGYELLVDRTRIKPGSPLIAAKRGNCLFCGMPGYPAAFAVNLFAYLIPVVKKLSGLAEHGLALRPARLTAPIRGREGRWDMVRVKLSYDAEGCLATPLQSQLTSHFLNMGVCDGLAMLGGDCAGLSAGQTVQVVDFAANLTL
jgi:molybdopterin molybdotransferase